MKERLPFVRGMIYWVGFKQVSISYDREARHSGKTKFPIYSYKVIRNFLFSALISFSSAPLLITIALGLIMSAVSFIVLIYVVIQWIVLPYVTPGWTALMAAIAFFGSLQLLTSGINGLYINTIFLETKQRPLYILKSIYGPSKK
jgi:dolichol-phosphate mannosyltransferase